MMTIEELYFGYGSNLNEDDWNSSGDFLPWKEALQIYNQAYLLDHIPVYHYFSKGRGGGALDVQPLKGGTVNGMLFQPTVEGWENVEKKEGSPNYYFPKKITVQTITGELLEAITYMVVEHRKEGEFIQPSKKYQKIVHEGMKNLELNPDGQNGAAVNDESVSMCNNVFVYGTLKQGFSRENSMKEGRNGSPRPGKISGVLMDLGPFPGLVQGDNEVIGELHSFTEIKPALDRLDEIEGFYGYGKSFNLFERILCNVETDNGKMLAWTYRWIGSDGIPIKSGEWSKR